MPREDSVIWRVIHDNQRVARDVGQQLLGEPFGEEVMVHLAVIVPCCLGALAGQFRSGDPAALGHRMENDEPFSFACRLLYPWTICIAIPHKIVTMILLHIRLIQIDFGANHRVSLTIGTLLAERALTRSDNLIFFLEGLGARSLTECKAPSIQRTTQCPQTELLIRSFLRKPFSYHLKRNVGPPSVALTCKVPGLYFRNLVNASGRTASTLRCAPVQHIWASVKVRHDPFHRCYPYS